MKQNMKANTQPSGNVDRGSTAWLVGGRRNGEKASKRRLLASDRIHSPVGRKSIHLCTGINLPGVAPGQELKPGWSRLKVLTQIDKVYLAVACRHSKHSASSELEKARQCRDWRRTSGDAGGLPFGVLPPDRVLSCLGVVSTSGVNLATLLRSLQPSHPSSHVSMFFAPGRCCSSVHGPRCRRYYLISYIALSLRFTSRITINWSPAKRATLLTFRGRRNRPLSSERNAQIPWYTLNHTVFTVEARRSEKKST